MPFSEADSCAYTPNIHLMISECSVSLNEPSECQNNMIAKVSGVLVLIGEFVWLAATEKCLN